MIAILLLVIIATNYIYQGCHKRDWEAALERSYFQAIAVGQVWLGLWLLK